MGDVAPVGIEGKHQDHDEAGDGECKKHTLNRQPQPAAAA